MAFKIKNNTLTLPTGLQITFQRTLRIPDDGKTHALPPGFGNFPIRNVHDYASTVPKHWLEHGGVFLPMYQREAMWMSLSGWPPHAVKVGVGKVCALTGEPWSEDLHKTSGLFSKHQDYLVTPPQPWLDGICVGEGRIKQFVAMPLGQGYTVEGQVTGEETHGGLQLKVVPPKLGRFPKPKVVRSRASKGSFGAGGPPMPCAAPMESACLAMDEESGGEMGLAAGGSMKQKIHPDPYGLETWDNARATRCFVHIVDSLLWRQITGEEAPSTPITAKQYASAGLPWYDLYDEGMPTLDGTDALKGVKSVKEIDATKSTKPLQDDGSIGPVPTKTLWQKLHGAVSDGSW